MTTYRNLTEAFPDFDITTLPAIPASWTDESWKNESCPCFHDETDRITIYIDYLDPSLKEFEEMKRFVAKPLDASGSLLEDETRFLETDDWAEVLAFVAAEQKKNAAEAEDARQIAEQFGVVTDAWTVGAYVEYQNGFGTHVRHVDGEFAILEVEPASHAGEKGFIVARGFEEEFSFPFEEDPIVANMQLALAQLAAAKDA